MTAEAIAAAAVSGTDVKKLVEASLKVNLPGALAGREAASGLTLPQPKSWSRMADYLKLPDQQSPAVYVVSAGLTDPPARQMGNRFRAAFAVGVACVIRGRSLDDVADRVGEYVAALRSALLADQTLGGLATRFDWLDEEYVRPRLAADTTQRTIGAGGVDVAYTFDRAADPDAT